MTAPTDTLPPAHSVPAAEPTPPAEAMALTEPDRPPARPRNAMDNLKYGALAVVVLLAGVVAIGNLSGATATPTSADADTAALAVVASDIVTGAKSGGAEDAIGGYLPGTGIVLTIQLGDIGEMPTEQWVSNHLDPFAETLAIMPADESIVVTINEVATDTARVWSLPVSALGTSVRDWNQLVAPASFESREVAVAAPADPADDTASAGDSVETVEDAPAPASADDTGSLDEVAEAPEETIEPEPAPEPETQPEAAAEPEPDPTAEPEPDPEPVAADDPPDVVDAGAGGVAGFIEGLGDGQWVSAFADPDSFSPNFGSWVLNDGIYSQQDATGFGYSAAYTGVVPDAYDVLVDMRAPNGDLNAGIIYGMPDAGQKNGGKVVDLTAESTYLRWGEYDPLSGDWSFIGGAPIDPGLAQDEWQNLKIEVRPEGTSVVLNGDFIATLDAVEPGGHVALVVSVASVEFRNFVVTGPGGGALDGGIVEDEPGELVDIEPEVVGDGNGDGDFDIVVFDDELREWNLLSGQWTAAGGVMTQANGQAFDQMVHFSNFEQDDYRVQVDLRAKEDSIFSGGLLFNIQTFGQRANSQLFDIVDDGQVIRWAGYDQNGVFSYVGGLRTSAGFDPDDWHTIAVEVRDGRAEFFIDGEFVGASDDVGSAGYVGLVTSLAAMEFRNFSIVTLS